MNVCIYGAGAAGGTAIVKALDKIIAKARKIAAHLMEASEADIEYERSVYTVKGTDRKKMLGEVAFAAYVPHNDPHDRLEPGLNENAFYDPSNFTFPAGTYLCEVEVDPETGQLVTVMARRAIEHLFAQPGITVEDRASVEGALANLRAGFDFADALHHASSRSCAAFLSFDKRRFANRARRMALTPPVRVPA